MPANLIADGSFKPLWEHDGIAHPLQVSEPSKGMAWPLDTTADLVSALIENYGAWPDVTPAMSTAMLLQFAQTASERVGQPPEQYLNLMLPIAIPAFKHHVSTMPQVASRQAYDTYIQNALLVLEGTPDPVASTLRSQLRSDASAQATLALPKVTTEQAWKNYVDEIGPALRNARQFGPPISLAQQQAYRRQQIKNLEQQSDEALARGNTEAADEFDYLITEVTDRKWLVRFNAPPSLAFRVANGLRPAHPALDVQVVGTVFQAPLLRKSGTGKSQFLLDEIAPVRNDEWPCSRKPPEHGRPVWIRAYLLSADRTFAAS